MRGVASWPHRKCVVRSKKICGSLTYLESISQMESPIISQKKTKTKTTAQIRRFYLKTYQAKFWVPIQVLCYGDGTEKHRWKRSSQMSFGCCLCCYCRQTPLQTLMFSSVNGRAALVEQRTNAGSSWVEFCSSFPHPETLSPEPGKVAPK